MSLLAKVTGIGTKALSEDVIRAVLIDLSNGKTLRAIARERAFDVSRWHYVVGTRQDVNAAWKEAVSIGCEAIAEQCLDIADEAGGDAYIDEKGKARIDGEAIARAKLRVETRLKLLPHWKPERYSPRVAHEITGRDGEAIQLEHRAVAVRDMLARLREAKRLEPIEHEAAKPGAIAARREGGGGHGRPPLLGLAADGGGAPTPQPHKILQNENTPQPHKILQNENTPQRAVLQNENTPRRAISQNETATCDQTQSPGPVHPLFPHHDAMDLIGVRKSA